MYFSNIMAHIVVREVVLDGPRRRWKMFRRRAGRVVIKKVFRGAIGVRLK